MGANIDVRLKAENNHMIRQLVESHGLRDPNPGWGVTGMGTIEKILYIEGKENRRGHLRLLFWPDGVPFSVSFDGDYHPSKPQSEGDEERLSAALHDASARYGFRYSGGKTDYVEAAQFAPS